MNPEVPLNPEFHRKIQWKLLLSKRLWTSCIVQHQLFGAAGPADHATQIGLDDGTVKSWTISSSEKFSACMFLRIFKGILMGILMGKSSHQFRWRKHQCFFTLQLSHLFVVYLPVMQHDKWASTTTSMDFPLKPPVFWRSFQLATFDSRVINYDSQVALLRGYSWLLLLILYVSTYINMFMGDVHDH